VDGKIQLSGRIDYIRPAAGLLERTVAPDHVAQNEYFTKEKVRIDWQFMLVMGIFLGALISSATDRSLKLESVPPTWEKRFGPSIGKRAIGAFLGGIVAMVGARMADGCPAARIERHDAALGKFLCALGMFFSVGVLVAAIVYGRRSS
jgi:hypothetical protein